MPTLSFTLTQAAYEDLVDAYCEKYGYQAVTLNRGNPEKGSMAANPLSREEFALGAIQEEWTRAVGTMHAKVNVAAAEKDALALARARMKIQRTIH